METSKSETYWCFISNIIQQQLKSRTLSDKKKALKKVLKEHEKQDGDIGISLSLDENSEQISSASDNNNEQISASGYWQAPDSIATIFNAVLEDKDAPLREQYHQLNTSKQRVTLKSKPPAILKKAPAIEELKIAIASLLQSETRFLVYNFIFDGQ